MQVFKNSRFPPEIVKGLSIALDDLGDRPLIVRSSSLLEDRVGSAFSGKYKSLFLANQGRKAERLAALLDAIAEVYASVFGPDPIEYRAERGLLEFHEEMGIMIQEVVGTRVGRYFLPAFAGVAFSHNEFRWSPRIRREDGLLRLVPGLGTRAVDRLADDYPVLVAPGQPGLRVNATPDEVFRYSPRKIDVINLETNSFETVDRHTLLREVGDELPGLTRLVSLYEHDMLRLARRRSTCDFDEDNLVVTFEGLLSHTPFLARMQAILKELRDALGTPVDIEFASDGRDLYLLQCRPQSHAPRHRAGAHPPRPAARARRVLGQPLRLQRHRARHHPHRLRRPGGLQPSSATWPTCATWPGGRPPERRAAQAPVHPHGPGPLGQPRRHQARRQRHLLGHQQHRHAHRDRAQEGQLRARPVLRHALLPGPGRVGHPLPAALPGRPGHRVQRARSCRRSENMLPRLLPEFAHLADTVRVIDVPGGDRRPGAARAHERRPRTRPWPCWPRRASGPTAGWRRCPGRRRRPAEDHWRWRLRMAERIAADLDARPLRRRGPLRLRQHQERHGRARAATSTCSSTSAAAESSAASCELWLEGWSLCLAEMNYLRTGYRTDGLLDVHLVTDEDIANADQLRRQDRRHHRRGASAAPRPGDVGPG